MSNPDRVLKTRDITLLTKVYIVKAMVFPVVVCGCESWAIKKTEHWRMDTFELWVLEKTLESPLDSKEIKPVNPKGNQSWIFIGRTDAEALTLWPLDGKSRLTGKDLMLGKTVGRKRRGQQRMGWLDGITDSRDINFWELQETVKDTGVWCAAVHGVAELDTT